MTDVDAEREAARWSSLALVASFSPPARAQLVECGVDEELLALPQQELPPLLHSMVTARELAKRPTVLALKPAEHSERELVLPEGPVDEAIASHSGPHVLLLIARYSEDIQWMQDSLPAGVVCHVMQKHALQSELPSASQTLLPNIGRESHSYLSHLAHLHAELHAPPAADGGRVATAVPPLLVCTQANPFEHNPSFLDDLAKLARSAARGVVQPFTPLGLWSGGERRIWCDASGAPHQPKLLPIGQVWKALFGATRPLPVWLGFTPGALFAVSRDALRRTPSRVFEVGLGPEGGLGTVDPLRGHVFERLWWYIFDDGLSSQSETLAQDAQS